MTCLSNASCETGTGNLTDVAVHPFVYYSIGMFIFVLFIFAFAESLVFLLTFMENRKLRTSTNYWVIALIICDLFIVVLAFPMLFTSSFAEELIFGDDGCLLDGFTVTSFGAISIYLLTGLSIQRYFIMMRDIGRHRQLNRKTIACIALCFLLGLIWGALPLFGIGGYTPEGIGLSCSLDWKSSDYGDQVYIRLMFLFVFFLPLFIITFCSTSVLIKVWRAKRHSTPWLRSRGIKREIRVTVAVTLTTVSFIVCWTPYAVVHLAGTFFSVDVYDVHPMVVQIPCLVAKSACVWNPIVFVCSNSDFRKAIHVYLSDVQITPEIHVGTHFRRSLNNLPNVNETLV